MSWTWTGYDYDAVHRFKDESFFQTGRNSAEARFWKLKIHEEVDRRGTKSSIAFDKDNKVVNGEYEERSDEEEDADAEAKDREKSPSPDLENDKYSYQFAPPPSDYSKDFQYSYAPSQTEYSKDYHYTYPNPRDRSMSIVSTISSRSRHFTATKDYQYSYPGELEGEDEKEQINDNLVENVTEESFNEIHENNDTVNEEKKEEMKMRKKAAQDCFQKSVNNLKTIRENHFEYSQDHMSSRFY